MTSKDQIRYKIVCPENTEFFVDKEITDYSPKLKELYEETGLLLDRYDYTIELPDV